MYNSYSYCHSVKVDFMQILTIDQVQKMGGFLLSDGRLNFQKQLFVKGGSFPETSKEFLSSMVEKYRNSGIECLLLSSNGMVTIWRMEKASSPTLPTQLSKQKFTIVHIDDSPVEGKIMAKFLEELNHDFFQINNAMLAIANLLKIKPDLVFLDLNMPVVNGYEICTQLRRVEIFKETPVVIVTGNDGLIDRVRAKMAGATDFISKPIDREKITLILHKYLPSS